RIADKRVLRLIRKWVNAGVIEDGAWTTSDQGASQGSLCAAAHNDPYEQYWFMDSVQTLSLVETVAVLEHCA
ncbi:MAG: hypothetical protein ACYDEY_16335, partial [Acidimicrobiales bacterium]